MPLGDTRYVLEKHNKNLNIIFFAFRYLLSHHADWSKNICGLLMFTPTKQEFAKGENEQTEGNLGDPRE